MIQSGKLIEYLENGRFVCALVTTSQPKRVHLVNHNGREVKLPVSRVVHCSQSSFSAESSREEIINHLKEVNQARLSLMEQINLEEIWELVRDEPVNRFSPTFLAELNFGDNINDDIISALLRCIFNDRLYFKYKEGQIKVHTAEQVEQLKIQREREQEKLRLIREGAEIIRQINMGKEVVNPDLQDKVLSILRDYYLFSNDSKTFDTAKQMLAEAGMKKVHDPFHLLVKAGRWDENENIPLLKNNLPVSFSLAARQQAERLLQTRIEELFEDEQRADLTHLKPITIDGATTLDFDDALSIEEKEGNYLVGVHISDVAHYVRPGDALFLEAMQRGTSLYLPEGQIPMLPRHLSQGICSLIQGETRAAFSFMILLSPQAEVLRVRVKPSVIRVARRMTYEEVDSLLETDREISILNKLTQKLRDRRIENGALLLPFPDVNIFIDTAGKVHVSLGKSDTASRILVSEMMILANSEAARYVSDRMTPGLFRAQGILKNRIVHDRDDNLIQNIRQRKHLPRGELITEARPHSGLGLNQYSTVTSPIRRLLDLVMQHQLNSIVRRREPIFNQDICQDFCSVITRVVGTANNVKQQRYRYWLLKYYQERKGSFVDALVVDSGPKRVNLVLQETLMEIDLPAGGGQRIPSETIVKVKVVDAEPLDNRIRFDWV